MSGLPKAIVKKYGVTKKAWAIFRGKGAKRKSIYTPAHKNKSMARKTRHSTKKHSFRRSNGLGKYAGLIATGAALLYGATRGSIVSSVAPSINKLHAGKAAPYIYSGGAIAGVKLIGALAKNAAVTRILAPIQSAELVVVGGLLKNDMSNTTMSNDAAATSGYM